MDATKPILLITLAGLLLPGCGSQQSSPPMQETSAAVAASDDASSIASLPSDVPALDDVEPETGQEVIQAMQNRLQASNGGQGPTLEDIESTIAYGKKYQKRFPADDELVQALTAMMYQSIRFLEDDPKKLGERRLELGEMARLLLSKPKVASELGKMLSFLLLEEAKGLIQNKQLKKAWQAIAESRSLGFDQSKLLFLDPAFDPIVQNQDYVQEIQTWLTVEIDKEIAQQEAFPFSFSHKSLVDDDAAEISSKDFIGKKLILIDLWGTWCPPCRAAIPHLVTIQDKFEEQLTVVGINFEQPIGQASIDDTKTRLEEFSASQPINYPCVYGDYDPRTEIPGFQGFPSMLLVDKKGRVRLFVSGYQPLPVLEATIRQVLSSME